MEYVIIFVFLLVIVGLVLWSYKLWEANKEFRQTVATLEPENRRLNAELEQCVNRSADLSEYAERLRPYSELADADAYAKNRMAEGDSLYSASKNRADAYVISRTKEGDSLLERAKAAAEDTVGQAKEEAKKIRERQSEREKEAERILAYAYAQSSRITDEAKKNAESIAGDAYYALENARHLEATASAMSDLITGYGDKYLVSTESWVDALAGDWGHKEAGRELKAVRIRIKQMTEGKAAAESDYVEEQRREYALSFIIDAFNGKIDSILAKARHNNYGKLEKQVKDAYHIVNHHGAAFRNTRITEQYFNCRMTELYWVVAANELQKREREEQQAIKQAIREEERARKEYEKAIRQAEKEEDMLNKLREQARAEIGEASEEERLKLEAKLHDLDEKLREAEEKNQRALSMAQQTKRGHVYIISNIGSFGENIFKIGMTRRLEPLDRVKELGDASVPFSFDVHAMIFSEDAPGLEAELHRHFDQRRVNMVNHRKEFFRTSLTEIRDKISENEIVDEVHWTLHAEALQFRETQALAAKEG